MCWWEPTTAPQQAGWRLLCRPVEAGGGPVVVGLGALVVSEGSPRLVSGEQGSRHHVRGRPPATWVEAPSHGGGAALGVVWEGGGGFVCHPPQHPLLTLVWLEQLSVIVVAPDPRSVPWYVEMTHMLADQPWTIPQFWGALSQERGCDKLKIDYNIAI